MVARLHTILLVVVSHQWEYYYNKNEIAIGFENLQTVMQKFDISVQPVEKEHGGRNKSINRISYDCNVRHIFCIQILLI